MMLGFAEALNPTYFYFTDETSDYASGCTTSGGHMNLSAVSKTGLLLLICRAVVDARFPAEYGDPQAKAWLERLLDLAHPPDLTWIKRELRIYQGMHGRDARAAVRRARIFDRLANDFIAQHPGCTVVNLGCGLDSRYWRIDHENCIYFELDLPEVIDVKRELMGGDAPYEMIGCSVLDPSWIDQVTRETKSNVLLLAEGLFMFFPCEESARVFGELSSRLTSSQIIFDMVYRQFTHGIWQWLMRLETRQTWGLDVAWVDGIRTVKDVESWAVGLKVRGSEMARTGPIIILDINENH
jgi:O-methyltransferase involved in polyketide biosynthesis